MRKVLRLAVALALMPLAASAAVEDTVLFTSGAWMVTASYKTNTNTSNLACWAETWNSQGQAFSIVVDQTTSRPSLMIDDERW